MKLNKRNVRDILFLLILGVYTYLTSGLINSSHGWGDDFAAYILQSQSILSGNIRELIGLNKFIMQNSSFQFGPEAAPWGTPLLLSPLIYLFGVNIAAFKIGQAVCYFIFLIIIYLQYVRNERHLFFVFYVAFFAFNPVMLMGLGEILSDIPFLLFSTLGLMMVLRTHTEEFRTHTFWYGMLTGAVIFFAYQIRSNGIFLLVVLVASQLSSSIHAGGNLLSCSSKVIKNLLPALTFILVASLISKHFLPSGGDSHYEFFVNLSVSQLLNNLSYNFSMVASFFLASNDFVVYLLTIPLFFIGVFFYWRKQWALLLYMALTLALYSIWPFRQGIRYMYPIIPIYLIFMFWGIKSISLINLVGVKLRILSFSYKFLLVALVIYLLSESLIYVNNIKATDHSKSDGPFGTSANKMYTFIRENTNKEDIIVFRKPRLLLLMTDRRSLMLNSPHGLNKAQYIVLDRYNESELLKEDFIKKRWKGLLVYSNDNFDIYKIIL